MAIKMSKDFILFLYHFVYLNNLFDLFFKGMENRVFNNFSFVLKIINHLLLIKSYIYTIVML